MKQLLSSLQDCLCIHISSKASEVSEIFSDIESGTNIIFMLVTGVCAIIAISFISKLKEKTIGATFSFWVQLRIRLLRIKNRLENNHGLLNNLYSNEVKEQWPNTGISATHEEVNDFYEMVEETILFMSNSEDQMPAYQGWVEDYNCIVNFFDDILYYDIRNKDKKFKYHGNETLSERDSLCDEKCELIEKLINKMLNKQKEAEKKINKK